jgi:hypothetical protein
MGARIYMKKNYKNKSKLGEKQEINRKENKNYF